MSIKKRLLKGGMSMLALRAFSILLMLALNACLTRWMTPAEMASYLAGMNLLIFMSLLGMAGLNQSMLRFISGKKSNEVSYRSLLLRSWGAAATFSVVVTIVFSVLLRGQLGSWLNIDPQLILSMLVCSLLLSAHKLMSASLRSVHAIASSSLIEGRSGGPLANIVYFPIVGVFAFGGLTALQSFWAFAIAMVLTIPVGVWMTLQALKAADAESADREEKSGENELGAEANNILAFSAPFLLSQVLMYFAGEFDVLLAKAYVLDGDTALFGSARRLILQMLAPVQIVTASVGSTIAELYARDAKEDLQKVLRYTATVACAVTFPLLLLCVAFPGFILGTIFGPFYSGGATVFAIMACGQMVNTITGQCGALLMLSGRTHVVLTTRAIAAVALILVGIWAVQNYGIVGLATATSCVVAMQNIVFWLLAKVLVGHWTHPTLKLRKPAISAKVKSKGKEGES